MANTLRIKGKIDREIMIRGRMKTKVNRIGREEKLQ